VKDLLSLWKVLAQDMGKRCAVDTTLDYDLVERRVEHQGLPFLTIDLPDFGKSFERWIDQSQVCLADTPKFRSSRGLPLFLRGFLMQVFDFENGALLLEPNVDAILAVRQLCGVYGKLFLQASPDRTKQAMTQYINTDHEVREWEYEWHSDENLAFSRIAMLLFDRVFDRVNSDVAHGTLVPKHGPGSTADGLLGNEKYHAHWTWRLEEYFSSDLFLLPNPRFWKILEDTEFKNPEDELPVKVISVPKTAKTPRIIAMEPVCMQYAQQALSKSIVKGLDEDYILKRFLRLDRQEVNQLLAREGSITGSLATLDLSEASDRVSNELVRSLTGRWQHLDGAIQACRSRQAIVRLGDEDITVSLAKFASMGSALTFPLETIIFLIIALVGIEKSLGKRLRVADLFQLTGKVAVYGDDIIVPTDHVGSVVHALGSFGFKVNSQKSFWTGRFRESCGKDYYGGIDVSYVKMRQMWPDDRRNVEEVVALVSFFNQCKDAHYTDTTDFLRRKISKLLGGFFPRVSRDSEILGEWDDINHDIIRLCTRTHRPLSKGYVIQEHIPLNPLDGERALLKFFLNEGDEPLDRNHLQRSGRSRAVSIKLRTAAT